VFFFSPQVLNSLFVLVALLEIKDVEFCAGKPGAAVAIRENRHHHPVCASCSRRNVVFALTHNKPEQVGGIFNAWLLSPMAMAFAVSLMGWLGAELQNYSALTFVCGGNLWYSFFIMWCSFH
jgi:hypothetical protein